MNDICDFSFVTSDVNATNGSVALWDGCTGSNLMILNGLCLSERSMTVVRDTVVGCVAGKALLEIWSLNNDGKKKVIPLPSAGHAIEYSSKFNILACFLGCDVFMWQPDTGQLLAILKNIHSNRGTEIIFTQDNRLITTDDSGLIAIWRLDMISESDCIWNCRPFGLTSVFSCLLLGYDSLLVVSTSGKIIILSLLDGSPLCDMLDIELKVYCVLNYKNNVFFGCNNGILATLSLKSNKIKKTIIKPLVEVDHEITQLALTPDNKSLIIVVDRRTAFFIDPMHKHTPKKRLFTFGSPLNCLRVINKSTDMFLTNSQHSKILIKRLEFSMDRSINNRNIEINLVPKKMSADDFLSNIVMFNDYSYDNLRLSGMIENENERTKLLKSIFSALNK